MINTNLRVVAFVVKTLAAATIPASTAATAAETSASVAGATINRSLTECFHIKFALFMTSDDTT
jgi:hypothetical protein